MGDQIFLLIFVELFCGEPAEEFRGPSEVCVARRIHITFSMGKTGAKLTDENLAGG